MDSFAKKFLKIWKYSLGSFSDEKTAPYDNYVAGIRTIIFVSYMVTNIFIISGVIRHWDSQQTVPLVNHAIDDRAILKK
jgi:hypothetical protein